MSVAITFLFTSSILLLALFGFATDLIDTYALLTRSWTALQDRSLDQANTRIAGPIGLSIAPSSTVSLTISNEGSRSLSDFARWNVFFDVRASSSATIAHLAYTQTSSPAANQWTVQDIYILTPRRQ